MCQKHLRRRLKSFTTRSSANLEDNQAEADPPSQTESEKASSAVTSLDNLSIPTFSCDECPSVFEFGSELNWHKMAEHMVEENFSGLDLPLDDDVCIILDSTVPAPKVAERDFKCGEVQGLQIKLFSLSS